MAVVEKLTKREAPFNVINFLSTKPLHCFSSEDGKRLEIYGKENSIEIPYTKNTQLFKNANSTVLCVLNHFNHSCRIVYSKFGKLAQRKVRYLFGCTDIEVLVNKVYFYNSKAQCIFIHTLD
jgi:hypothetical protein